MDLPGRAIVGSILGCAVGDALGLPYEGLSARRAARLFGPPDRYRLLPGRGMISDDTEHATMVMQSLIVAGEDADRFAGELARRLRWWLAALPAGAGLATLKATAKLWVGVPPRRSGVFSAGNGPAMRSPVLGAAVERLDLLKRLVRASTRLTHTDPKAEYGALAVALAARMASQAAEDGPDVSPEAFLGTLGELLAGEPAEELFELLDRAVEQLDVATPEFCRGMGWQKGVSGYVYQTVPAVVHAWLRHQRDLPEALLGVIRCGGDTDSTAAVTGGIVGCTVGKEGIPQRWLAGLWEWPRSVAWMERLAVQLAEARAAGQPRRPLRLPVWGVLPRNLLFTAVVLGHGFRRLLPPY